MTEYSMFWDSCSTGDARLAPYTARLYRSLWWKTLISDKYHFAAVACTPSGAGLKVSINDAATQVTVGEGSAIIDGVYYWTDGVTLTTERPSSGYYAYTVALRKTQSSKTVRMVILGPQTYLSEISLFNGGYPGVTQNDDIWEVPIAYVAVYATGSGVGSRGIHDLLNRIGPNHSQIPALIYRQGNGNDWNAQGTTDYETDENVKVQVGMVQWTGVASTSGNVGITFPKPWTFVPAVFAQCQNGKVLTSTQQNTTTATFYWRCMDATTFTSVNIFWIAIGRKDQL